MLQNLKTSRYSPSKINKERIQIQQKRNRSRNTAAGLSFFSEKKKTTDRYRDK